MPKLAYDVATRFKKLKPVLCHGGVALCKVALDYPSYTGYAWAAATKKPLLVIPTNFAFLSISSRTLLGIVTFTLTGTIFTSGAGIYW